jgi:site-specific DNA recombinase
LNGASIEFVEKGRDINTVEGLAMDLTDQLVSGIERMNIRRRTMGARREIARNGRIIPTAWPVYGYKIIRERDTKGRMVDARYEIDEETAPVVVMIFELAAYEGLSAFKITKRLGELGIEAPKGGYTWGRSTVTSIINNKTYIGDWHYNKHDTKRVDTADGVKREMKVRPEDEWIPVDVPALVSVGLFRAAQESLSKNKAWGHKPTKHQYLLRGRVRCARCNSLLVGNTATRLNKNGEPYERKYKCRKSYSDYRTNKCQAKTVNQVDIEEAVWWKVRELLLDPRRLLEGVEAERESAMRARQTIEAAIANIDNEITKLEGKMDRFLDLYGSGDMSKEQYRHKRQEIEKEITKKNAERLEWAKKMESYSPLTPEQQEQIAGFMYEVAQGIDNATFEDKVKYLTWLKIECIYDDRTADLTITGLLGNSTLNMTSRCWSGWKNG